MMIVNTTTLTLTVDWAKIKPWCGCYICTTVFSPVDVWLTTKYTCAFFLPTSFASINGRMLRRTPSFRSGFQPIGCSSNGFQRTKMSKPGPPGKESPARIASSCVLRFSAAVNRISAPSLPSAKSRFWVLIQSSR